MIFHLLKKRDDTDPLTTNLFSNFHQFNDFFSKFYFDSGKIVTTVIQEDDSDFEDNCDFIETFIGFENLKFSLVNFNRELDKISIFVNYYFENCPDMQYALCSFEMNGYLLSDVKKLADINDELLNKFPIVFKREGQNKSAAIFKNLDAQDIF